ncbi:MAG: hypothetical protein ACRCUF_12305 [Aeromonas sobria]
MSGDLPETRRLAKELGSVFYFTGKKCKRDHLDKRYTKSGDCLSCKAEYMAGYLEENKEAIATQRAGYVEENREAIAAQRADYHIRNRDAILAKAKVDYLTTGERQRNYSAKYRKENQEAVNEYAARYRKKHSAYYLARDAIKRLEGNGLVELLGGMKMADAEALCGYANQELVDHITGLFEPGMSWDDRGEWHIDHIKPVAAFRREGVTCVKTINALSNLRPVWAKENLTKGAKW